MNPREKAKRLSVPKLPCMVFFCLGVISGFLLATANPMILSQHRKADAPPKGGRCAYACF